MAAHDPPRGYASAQTGLEPLLTVNEAASVLNVSRRKLYDLIRAHEIATVRVGERLRVHPKDLRAYLERRRV